MVQFRRRTLWLAWHVNSWRDSGPGHPGVCHHGCIKTRESLVRDGPIDVTELAPVYRSEYLHAVEMARATDDPCEDWDAFVEVLWSALVPAFGLDVEVLDTSEHREHLDGLQGPSD